VDLFNESSINWKQGDTDFSLKMQTAFPENPEVRLQWSLKSPAKTKIRIRVPSWATKPVEIYVNGKKQATGNPGAYVTLERRWKNRDEIRFTLPMGFRLIKYAGIENDFQGKNAFALEYGPILMAVVGNPIQNGMTNIPLTETELLKNLKPVAGKPLHFTINNELEYIPYYDVQGELRDTFTCYPFLKKQE
jgi:DUF1680 family protein